ncbi:DUF72 domain-containing protein [Coralloluteibacterium stylophorae]|uniref:DUF72 domain-containing protein n=1 Tax=Coralloluteibacterium stylophorae TaxID=1776034 RepID=A0A8J7VVI9_9GAMM|nr:DUF72 domain-containing protein [Coralloluteibacterium stylophorae]MBS7456268.1 DUF72 domain-containing protein [Coralloluteibacterium stylophorae]
MAIRIGISGWRYAPWRGVFYPAGLPQRAELQYAAQRMGSIELNGSFYSLQTPESYVQWRDATPQNFVFAVKGPRFVTHMLRLRDPWKALANFFASGVLCLDAKFGPMLWQLPARQRWDAAVLEAFLEGLPKDTAAALELARGCEPRIMRGRSALAIDRSRPIRHAIEVRDASFRNADFIALLRRHNVALVVADTAGQFPYLEDVTADFVYIRLHGDTELYASGYSGAALDGWAQRIRAWAAGGQPQGARVVAARRPARRRQRDVYCYFDNDAKVHAPFDAQALMERLGSS